MDEKIVLSPEVLRLREFMWEVGYDPDNDQARFVRDIGLPVRRSGLNHLMRGRVESIGHDILSAMHDKFSLNLNWILCGSGGRLSLQSGGDKINESSAGFTMPMIQMNMPNAAEMAAILEEVIAIPQHEWPKLRRWLSDEAERRKTQERLDRIENELRDLQINRT